MLPDYAALVLCNGWNLEIIKREPACFEIVSDAEALGRLDVTQRSRGALILRDDVAWATRMNDGTAATARRLPRWRETIEIAFGPERSCTMMSGAWTPDPGGTRGVMDGCRTPLLVPTDPAGQGWSTSETNCLIALSLLVRSPRLRVD